MVISYKYQLGASNGYNDGYVQCSSDKLDMKEDALPLIFMVSLSW